MKGWGKSNKLLTNIRNTISFGKELNFLVFGAGIMIIASKHAVLRQIAFELKFRYGYRYLDVCGDTINHIVRNYPEWIVKGSNISPQNAPLVSLKNGCSFNFSSEKLDLSLQKPIGEKPLDEKNVEEFVEQTNLLSSIAIDKLEVGVFTRIGVRVWHTFQCQNKEEAEEWLLKLGVSEIKISRLGIEKANIEAVGLNLIVEGEDRKFRIALNGVESQQQYDLGDLTLSIREAALHKRQKELLQAESLMRQRMRENPQYAALIDVDTFIDDPISFEPKSFIESSMEMVTQMHYHLNEDV